MGCFPRRMPLNSVFCLCGLIKRMHWNKTTNGANPITVNLRNASQLSVSGDAGHRVSCQYQSLGLFTHRSFNSHSCWRDLPQLSAQGMGAAEPYSCRRTTSKQSKKPPPALHFPDHSIRPSSGNPRDQCVQAAGQSSVCFVIYSWSMPKLICLINGVCAG